MVALSASARSTDNCNNEVDLHKHTIVGRNFNEPASTLERGLRQLDPGCYER